MALRLEVGRRVKDSTVDTGRGHLVLHLEAGRGVKDSTVDRGRGHLVLHLEVGSCQKSHLGQCGQCKTQDIVSRYFRTRPETMY